MEEEKAILDFRLKKTDEAKNYFLEEIKCNKLISKKDEKTCELY